MAYGGFFLQLAAGPSRERSKRGYWLVDPRWSHVNVSLTSTNQLSKNIKQVILFIFQEDKHKTTRCKHHCTQLQPVLDVITQKVQVKATGEWFAWKIWRQFLYWAPLSWPSVYLSSKELACFCRNKKKYGHSSAVKKATASVKCPIQLENLLKYCHSIFPANIKYSVEHLDYFSRQGGTQIVVYRR